MASKRKELDAKAKAKKQKVIAIGGAVLLLAILAFEIPNTMKLMKQSSGQSSTSSSQPAAATTTTTASTAPATGTPAADGSLTPPTLSGSASASTPASSSGLVNSDPAPTVSDGELGNLDQFVAKDPFKQQLAVTGTSDASSGSSDSSSGSGDASNGSTDKTPTPPAAGGSAVPPTDTTSGPTAPTPPVADPTIATIAVNGASQDVQTGGTFPRSASQPFFKLVSLGPTSVKIGIAGGSLAGGDPTVTLAKGKKLTLMNTADGTKYVLQLLELK
jgi:hypothetical protein